MAVTGTAESGPVILNQAALYPAGAPDQRVVSEWVVHFTNLWANYLPLLQKEEPGIDPTG